MDLVKERRRGRRRLDSRRENEKEGAHPAFNNYINGLFSSKFINLSSLKATTTTTTTGVFQTFSPAAFDGTRGSERGALFHPCGFVARGGGEESGRKKWRESGEKWKGGSSFPKLF